MPWITTRHAVRAAIRAGERGTLFVTSKKGANAELVQEAAARGVVVRTASSQWIRGRAGDRAKGVALETPARPSAVPQSVELDEWLRFAAGEPAERPKPILALDHITDPQNVGAILRSSLLFGVGLAILPTRRSASVGETVSRASAGASHLVPITYVANLRSALERCREAGWWLFAAESSGTPIDEVTLHPRSVFVLGAEGKGVSPNITKIADELVAVPTVQDAGGSVDSLNVSVAAGILLYEYRRRRP